MIKLIAVLLLIITFNFTLSSQIIADRQLISPFGTSTESTSSSLGETIIFGGGNSNIIVTQGFNQNETGNSVSTIETTLGAFEIQVYPNPCVDQFTVKLEKPELVQSISLIDPTGKIFLHKSIRKKFSHVLLDNLDIYPTSMMGLVIHTTAGHKVLGGWIVKTN